MPATSYLDTSFLLKAYLVEAASDEVANFLRTVRPRPLINSLSDVEVGSAFARELPEIEAQTAFAIYERDKLAQVYRQVDLTRETFELARKVILLHGREFRLRSLDALHLATAQQHGVEAFATYDGRLATAAFRLGFAVFGARP